MTEFIIAFTAVVMMGVFLKSKNILHPLIMFNFMWMVIFLLESLHLYGLYESDTRIYIYMCLGIIAFNAGYGIWNLFRLNHRMEMPVCLNSTNIYNDFIPRYQLLFSVGVVCLLYYLGTAFSTVQMLVSGQSLNNVREFVQSTSGIENVSLVSKIMNAVNILFLIPSASVIEAVAAIDFWFGNRNKKMFILGVSLAVCSSVGEGGRTAIVNFFLYMVIGFFMSGGYLEKKKAENMKNKKKRQHLFIGIAIVIGLFIFWFTMSRMGQALARNMYLYFSMQPYMFNLWANIVDDAGLYGYGEASFNGISFAILYVFKNIFNVNFPEHWKMIYDMIRDTDSQWQYITSAPNRANAYVTVFWFFYLDGRLPAIITGMFAYGAYVAHTFIEAVKKTNSKTVCIFAFIFQGLFYMFIRFPFSNIYYAISYIFLIFVAFKPVKEEVGID